MTLGADIMYCQTLLRSLMEVLQDKKYFSIARRGHAEEQHNLVHRPDLRGRRIPRLRPCVRLAFDQDRWIFAPKIEIVPLFDASADRNGEGRTEWDTSALEEELSGFLEFPPGMCIANGAATLEVIWIGHDVSPSGGHPFATGRFRQLVQKCCSVTGCRGVAAAAIVPSPLRERAAATSITPADTLRNVPRDQRFAHAHEPGSRAFGTQALCADPRTLKQQEQFVGEHFGFANARCAAQRRKPVALQ